MTIPERSVEKELKNKLVKHWWSDCLDPYTGELMLENIDGSDDFTSIPRNSKGQIVLEVGELRSIVDEIFKQLLQPERQRCDEMVKEFAEYLKGQLGAYVIEGKPVKDMEYDYPYNDLWGAIDGSVEDFTQPNNPETEWDARERAGETPFDTPMTTPDRSVEEEDRLKALITACGSKFQSLVLIPDGQLVDAETGKSVGERWYAYATDETYHNELGGDCVNDCCGQFSGKTPEEAVEKLLQALTHPNNQK